MKKETVLNYEEINKSFLEQMRAKKLAMKGKDEHTLNYKKIEEEEMAKREAKRNRLMPIVDVYNHNDYNLHEIKDSNLRKHTIGEIYRTLSLSKSLSRNDKHLLKEELHNIVGHLNSTDQMMMILNLCRFAYRHAIINTKDFNDLVLKFDLKISSFTKN